MYTPFIIDINLETEHNSDPAERAAAADATEDFSRIYGSSMYISLMVTFLVFRHLVSVGDGKKKGTAPKCVTSRRLCQGRGEKKSRKRSMRQGSVANVVENGAGATDAVRLTILSAAVVVVAITVYK